MINFKDWGTCICFNEYTKVIESWKGKIHLPLHSNGSEWCILIHYPVVHPISSEVTLRFVTIKRLFKDSIWIINRPLRDWRNWRKLYRFVEKCKWWYLLRKKNPMCHLRVWFLGVVWAYFVHSLRIWETW